MEQRLGTTDLGQHLFTGEKIEVPVGKMTWPRVNPEQKMFEPGCC